MGEYYGRYWDKSGREDLCGSIDPSIFLGVVAEHTTYMTGSEKKLPTDFSRCGGDVFHAKFSSKNPVFENRILAASWYTVYEEEITPRQQEMDS